MSQYISKSQTTFQESITIMKLKLPHDMKEEILEKAKIENLKTKIYLKIITLNLNLLENNIEEAYHQEEDPRVIFYYKINNIETPTSEDNRIENIDYDNNGDFENLDNE